MIKNNIVIESILTICLIGLLSFFINPLHLLMPPQLHILMVPTLLILFIIILSFLWKESPGDEREQLHQYIAGRFSYFAGISILFIAIIFQAIRATIDPWLIIAISISLLAKVIGRIYAYIKR